MKVECVQPPMVAPAVEAESSWVAVHSVYPVLALLAKSDGRVQLLITTDEPHSYGWFDALYFRTVDESMPANWIARVHPGGLLEIAPSAWMEVGFWESYYDADPEAERVLKRELNVILGVDT